MLARSSGIKESTVNYLSNILFIIIICIVGLAVHSFCGKFNPIAMHINNKDYITSEGTMNDLKTDQFAFSFNVNKIFFNLNSDKFSLPLSLVEQIQNEKPFVRIDYFKDKLTNDLCILKITKIQKQ
jgi:hypothetical protein